MSNPSIKGLLLAVTILLGIIVGIIAAWLAIAREAHIAIAVRDGGVGFAGTVTLSVLLLSHLEAL